MLIKLMDKVDWDVEMYLKIQMVEIIHTGIFFMYLYI